MNDDVEKSVTRQNIKNAVQDRFGFDIRDMQADAIRTLIHDQRDLILIARTGFGRVLSFKQRH